MKSNGVSSSTQSFGISERSSAMLLKRKRYIALFIAGILLAILIGFLLGYFIPKCNEDNQNWMPQSNASKNYEADLLAVLDSKAIENISRYGLCLFYIWTDSCPGLAISSTIINRNQFGIFQ